MNLPVFCRVLGEIALHDVDVGSAVLDTINFCIKDDEPKFVVTMTGVDMYVHYKSLSPASRLGLEDLELLSKSEWIRLSKECEMLTLGLSYTAKSSDMYMRGIYLFGVALCMVVTLTIGVGYLTNLSLKGDTPDSYILRILYDIVTIYSSETIYHEP